MTEENMKKQYDKFIELGLTERAKAISDIPRYAKFAKEIENVQVVTEGMPEEKPKSKEKK